MKRIFSIILIIFIFVTLVFLLNKCDISKINEKLSADNTEQIPEIAEDAPTVLIDAGHGFKDPGCESDYLSDTEAVITLKMAKELKKQLESKGIRVLLTHDGESFPTCKKIISDAKKHQISYDNSRMVENNVFSAYERVIYANTVNCETPIDLFISIHINSIENNPTISQYELYYYENNPYADSLKTLCSTVADKLDNYTKISATNSEESYTVTRYTDFPSLLIETGYATNKNDAKNLNSAKWRKTFLETISSEINNWLTEEKNRLSNEQGS